MTMGEYCVSNLRAQCDKLSVLNVILIVSGMMQMRCTSVASPGLPYSQVDVSVLRTFLCCRQRQTLHVLPERWQENLHSTLWNDEVVQ